MDSPIPVGTVIAYMGNDIAGARSQGWLLCDGSAVESTAFPKLCFVIGKTYGCDSHGNALLPNLKGMFLRGVDPDQAADLDAQSRTSPDPGNTSVAGPVLGSRQGDQVRNHQHNWNHNFGNISDSGDDLEVQITQNSPVHADRDPSPTTCVDGGGNETRPKNVYVYYLIYAG
jgi:hypothetical protein